MLEMSMDRLWLVNYQGHKSVMSDEAFIEFADRVKYDGVEYEATPLQTVGEYLDSKHPQPEGHQT
jgi:hypothetical protein